ncbi:hypothetical protein KXX35_005966 [Aspergillus fumigatus]|nr:hypothetical protein KXX63_000303 [Aspergillus fumigatus]KAH1419079.1 hypothetical protein KXX32_008904 [Aspergillus fumigatus]KAH1800795.1 hypothetical protein KXX20_008104 [Aspergillus fumigatus]KAH1828595.1 hypothetical protein KXX35_005966 [Aspergillus fumigatus]KAH2344113.1 hypothetical protein KXW30_000279 [Aspergillus fumigatus]
MIAPKPGLPPRMAEDLTFPSELREPHSTRYLDAGMADKKAEPSEDQTETITPPPAYTEFLGTFSPIFTSSTDSRASFAKYMLDKPRRSPTSAPSSAISSSFFCYSSSRRCTPVTLPPLTPATPHSATARSPDHLRRLQIPPPYHVSSASAIATPRSAQSLSSRSLYSPYSPPEWPVSQGESPVSQNGEVSVRHVVTTTITFKRAPQLEPPPPGKRRRIATQVPRET